MFRNESIFLPPLSLVVSFPFLSVLSPSQLSLFCLFFSLSRLVHLVSSCMNLNHAFTFLAPRLLSAIDFPSLAVFVKSFLNIVFPLPSCAFFPRI